MDSYAKTVGAARKDITFKRYRPDMRLEEVTEGDTVSVLSHSWHSGEKTLKMHSFVLL